ncbi:hypothetical protein SAY87_021112 [Trapa incisa]|uniref:PHD-type zinc finger plants domain-containing protein n=1 Tax=Trapa incisa TaxID=236973 RepID=A0AAN7PQN7_9MYRT|nr:hypothetical protein SAY87_021112 [Trapa incisa]
MVDLQVLCCMCGDVGFPEKLFRCNKCHNRFQHSYCSNYYTESSDPIERCDWCQSEERSNWRQGNSSKKSALRVSRSEYSPAEKAKQSDREEAPEKSGKTQNGTPSPRHAIRRYKLLKDVMC